MAKTTKKKNRRLKRQIRKTVGALLMVSAITVAAIPVPDVRADEVYEEEIIPLTAAGLDDGTVEKVKVLNQDVNGTWETVNGTSNVRWHSEIPYVPESASIYTDYNGRYRFAFVPNADGEYVAVILGANIGELDNYTLTIDPYLDAYKKYAANTSDLDTLCAVTRSDKFLYYYKDMIKMQGGYTVYTIPSLEQKGIAVGEVTEVTSNGKLLKDENGKWYYYNDEKDEEGNDITVPYEAVPKTEPQLTPCLRGEYDTWINKDLYYLDENDKPVKSEISDGINGRLYHADVAYIGRQYIEQSANGDWKIKGTVTKDNPERGVFAGNGNIRTLNIPSSLLGIGDYAFFRCGYLSDVKLGNGLSTIGNGAFAYCNNMTSCDLDIGSRSLAVIGKEAFLGCSRLENIRIPVSVDAIGDYCFKNCSNLKDIDMSGGIGTENYSDRLEMQLTTIGHNAFEGCSKLDKLIFPDGCTEKLPISYFKGCDQLRFISTLDRTYSFDIIDGNVADNGSDAESADHTACEIAGFLKNKPQFYFEGYDGSAIQKTAHLHSAAFSHIDTLTGNIANKFEKKVTCSETPSHQSLYVVNKDNQLIDMEIAEGCGEINIPDSIGPYSILEIAPRGFENNCDLKKIVIPSSIHTIGERAFGGCHNLKDVIFQSPANSNLVIEAGAFDTQSTQFTSDKVCAFCGETLKDDPTLTFTGDICLENSGENSTPFLYAMDPANNINITSQTESYITFYSGWPTNLTVEYNSLNDQNELIDYPKLDDLASYTIDSFPDMTKDRAKAAQDAYTEYLKNGNTSGLTPEQIGVIDSALNIVLPRGIEGIKTGIFSGVDSENKAVDSETVNDQIESITMHSVKKIEPYAFAKCPKLSKFYANELEEVGDYAFIGDSKLSNVDLGGTVTAMGIRPFAKCSELRNVGFTNNPNFVCNDAIIYGLTGGAKSSIVECLETRGQINPNVGPDELAGVTSIAEEAFKGCKGVITVDLSSASVRAVPRECFSQSGVSIINLSSNTRNIGKGAFWNSAVASVRYPSTISYIEPEAFADVKEDANGEIELDDKGDPTVENSVKGHSAIKFYYPEGEDSEDSVANIFAGNYYYIDVLPYDEPVKCKVYFYDNYDNPDEWSDPLKIEEVWRGESATPPEAPEHEGVVFQGWSPVSGYQNVQNTENYVFARYGRRIWKVQFWGMNNEPIGEVQEVEEGQSAQPPKDENGELIKPVREGWTFTEWEDYSNIGNGLDYEKYNGIVNIMPKGIWSDSEEGKCKVIFKLFDGSTGKLSTVSEQEVRRGTSATAPSVDPVPAGYIFSGWSEDFSNVQEDMQIIGSFVKSGSGSGNGSGSGSGSGNGSNSGNGSGSNSSPSPSSSTSPSPSSTPGVRKYTVSVSGGSGSGEYAAGEIVAVNAYYMGEGQAFDKWTSSTAGVGFSNPNATSATFTMPAANVAVTATYKTGSGNSVTPVSTNSGGGGGSNTVNTVSNNGTTVDVTRPGISNTNLAGATVSGATDNFIVKVTEDQAATDAVTAALQARYGDLSRIKYLPMDISLYDSTGRTKIADTSGISVNLTLPLPDDLVQYAGNNRVAAVSGGVLEDLNARFTTVAGVPCVNFTATHFSPYVIYVDTANLSEAVIDATPKTGDPIHPKWFLAIGLACVSLIMFFKRDKKVVINTKTA